MKKFLKVMLCLVLAFCMVLTFAACGEGTEGDGGSAKRDEKAAEKAVTSFLDAVCDLELRDAMEYTNDPDMELPFEDVDGLMTVFTDAMDESGAGDYASSFEPVFDAMIEGMCDSFSYEITDIEEDDGAYIYTVDIEYIDFDNMTDMEEAFGEIDIDGLAMDLVADGTITEDMTEDEMVEVLMEEAVDLMIPVVEDAIEDAGTTTETITITVIEEDGEWVIDADDSELDTFDSIFDI